VVVAIEGTDLPGRRCGPNPEERRYENIHVGLGRPPNVIGLMPADARTSPGRRSAILTRGPGDPLLTTDELRERCEATGDDLG
jgi:hypothetical protein